LVRILASDGIPKCLLKRPKQRKNPLNKPMGRMDLKMGNAPNPVVTEMIVETDAVPRCVEAPGMEGTVAVEAPE
jgi:hypothetical protein